ncbi:MAG TPA: IMP dehydrogenase [Nitrososphaerales archaeon]|nr:IMP dehydrogenase [Nitrososphaerales archaeon]
MDFAGKLKDAREVQTFRDYILLPGRSEVEPKQIDLSTHLTKRIRLELPFVSSPMDSVTEWKMAEAMTLEGGVGVIHRNLSIEDQVEQVKRVKSSRVAAKSVDERGLPLVGASVSPMDKERCTRLDHVADFLVTDVAHFHNSNVMKAAEKLIPALSKDFIVGNIGTGSAMRDILGELPRVDGFRVGIGSGSVCITSEVTRVGAPTLFAVSEVATALQEAGSSIPVIADGGIRGSGDAALSLASGASSVMLGSLLAGCAESPTKVVIRGGAKQKVHRGMASSAARSARFALDRYSVPAKGLDEGVEAYVPYSGTVREVVGTLASGLRAAFGYAGAASIESLWKRASFGLVSANGSSELGVHSLERVGGRR